MLKSKLKLFFVIFKHGKLFSNRFNAFKIFQQDPEYKLLDEKPKFDFEDKEIKDFNIQTEIPIQFKDLEKEGLFWISGYVAFEMRNVQKSLGQTTGRANERVYSLV